MTYNKNTWHRGDVVSSSGLNNMEEGIAANDAAISEIHDPANSAIADGGIGYYDKTTLLNETIPVADWVDRTTDAYAEIDVTGIELSEDKTYWIVIDGVETKCDYGGLPDEGWFIVPIDPGTPFPAIERVDNSFLFLAELPTEPVSFQLIEGEAQKIGEEFINHGNFFVGATYDNSTYTLDKTYNQIMEAVKSGENIVIQRVTDDPFAVTAFLFEEMYESSGDYYVTTIYNNAGTPTTAQFITSDPDEAPSFDGML